MRKSTVLFSLLLCSALSAAGQNFMLRNRPGKSKISLRLVQENRREAVFNALGFSAIVAGIVLPRMYPDKPAIGMGIPAGIALSALSYSIYIDKKPKRRK
jgi:hypothetical protein